MNQLKNFCFKAFHFLAIKKEERVVAYTILLLILFLNGLLVWHYHDTLTLFSDDYHKMFRNGFNVSGFDAWTYTVISKWSATQYNIFRHIKLIHNFCLPIYFQLIVISPYHSYFINRKNVYLFLYYTIILFPLQLDLHFIVKGLGFVPKYLTKKKSPINTGFTGLYILS